MEQSGRQADLAAVWYTESRLMRRLGSRGRVSLSLSLSVPLLFFVRVRDLLSLSSPPPPSPRYCINVSAREMAHGPRRERGGCDK